MYEVTMFVRVLGGKITKRVVPPGVPDGEYRIRIEVPEAEEKRNISQNSALHLFFEKVAHRLNAGGVGIIEGLRSTGLSHEVNWSGESVRSLLWNRLAKAYLSHAGRARYRKEDIREIYRLLRGHLKEKYHVDVPYPYDNNLSLYCEWVADALNERGHGVVNVIKPNTEWAMEDVKYLIWRPIQKKVLGVEATSSLLLRQITPVYDEINRLLGEMGIHVAFPTKKGKEEREGDEAA
jgi:hypothetical protein